MKAYAVITAMCITVALLVTPIVFAASEVTLVGEVNDNFQLYAGGRLYEVADNPVGNDLVTNYISEKVEVVGSVVSEGDDQILTVRTFRVVPE